MRWYLVARQRPDGATGLRAPLGAIKQKLTANPRYFEDLVQQSFLNNTHRTTLLLKPTRRCASVPRRPERAG